MGVYWNTVTHSPVGPAGSTRQGRPALPGRPALTLVGRESRQSTPNKRLRGCHVNLAPIFGLWRQTIGKLPEDALVQPGRG